jgi:thiamine biosynthesis lipoprotein
MPLRLLIWLLPFFIPVAESPVLKTFYISGYAQGTTYQVIYYAAEKVVTKAQAEHIFRTIDSSLSLYKPYSLINQFNYSTKGIAADEHLEKVVKRSMQIAANTEGAFDISVQPLVQAWGFGAEPVSELPDAATIKSLLSCVGKDKIYFEGKQLKKVAPCVKIDVNGIAQGYSVDVLAAFLEENRIQSYLVEVGGEIRIKGKKPGGEFMSVGIEGPGHDELDSFPIQKVISFDRGAVTTSGNYRRYYQHGTNKLSHLIDAKTGYPLQNELISVTVWASDAITADGYDNALMDMGLEKAILFVEQQKELEAYFIYHTTDGSVADTASSGFYQLIR